MRRDRRRQLTLVSSVFFAGFATVQLIGDFLFNVHQEFNLAIPLTLALSFAFMIGLVGLIAFSAAGSRVCFLGLSTAGGLISMPQLLKGIPAMLEPGIWRSGIRSVLDSIGLLLTAGLTAGFSMMQWRRQGL